MKKLETSGTCRRPICEHHGLKDRLLSQLIICHDVSQCLHSTDKLTGTPHMIFLHIVDIYGSCHSKHIIACHSHNEICGDFSFGKSCLTITVYHRHSMSAVACIALVKVCVALAGRRSVQDDPLPFLGQQKEHCSDKKD